MRVSLFAGTGGAGTTTAAAAAAARSAAAGARTLLLAADEAALADVATPDRWGCLGPRAEPGCVRRWIHPLLPGGLSVHDLPDVPGAALVRALAAAAAGRPAVDAVVADLGPVPAALALLALPDQLALLLRRAWPLARRMEERRTPGGGARVDAVDAVAAEVEALAALLRGPGLRVHLVLAADARAPAAADRAALGLGVLGLPLDEVLVNRYAADDPAQASLVALLAGRLPGALVHTVPLVPGGPDPVAWVPAAGPPAPEGPRAPCRRDARIRRVPDGYELAVPLARARRAEVEVVRAGDDLLVRVGAHQRVLPLPSGLRRCVAVGARLGADELVVRFVPDPDLWPVRRGDPGPADRARAAQVAGPGPAAGAGAQGSPGADPGPAAQVAAAAAPSTRGAGDG